MSAISAALPSGSPRDETAARAHPRIEIVSSRDQRRARPRLAASIVTVGGLFAILAAQLLLTIATSEGAYELSSLQAKKSELGRDEQVLREGLRILEAPQHIAAEAQGMGMVLGASTAYLRLADGAVLGEPAVASASAALLTAADGTSLIPNSLLAQVPLVGAAARAASAAAVPGGPALAGAPAAPPAPGSVASTPPVGIPSPNTH